LEVAQDHLRLDPFHPPHLHAIQGHALYMLGRYAEAIAPLRGCVRRGPAIALGQMWLAAALMRAGEAEEAHAAAAEARRLSPRMATHWLPLAPYRHSRDADHAIDALREAGFA
jgi:Flp pilus assembly protein TadD